MSDKIKKEMEELDSFIIEFRRKIKGKTDSEIALIAWEMAQRYRSIGYDEGWNQALDMHGVADLSSDW
jgi:hypothetical protein